MPDPVLGFSGKNGTDVSGRQAHLRGNLGEAVGQSAADPHRLLLSKSANPQSSKCGESGTRA